MLLGVCLDLPLRAAFVLDAAGVRAFRIRVSMIAVKFGVRLATVPFKLDQVVAVIERVLPDGDKGESFGAMEALRMRRQLDVFGQFLCWRKRPNVVLEGSRTVCGWSRIP